MNGSCFENATFLKLASSRQLVATPNEPGVLDTTLCDKVCQLRQVVQVVFSGFLHQ